MVCAVQDWAEIDYFTASEGAVDGEAIEYVIFRLSATGPSPKTWRYFRKTSDVFLIT
jgi:hypothetical protein